MVYPDSGPEPAPPTFHERIAATRWGSYISDREREAILWAHRSAAKPGTVLDVGCEGGRWSILLSELGWKPVCVDVDAEAVETCARRLPDARCVCLDKDYDRFPCDDASVDLVLCIEVPPVIHSEWFLSECRRVLTHEGLVVTVFWNRGSVRGHYASWRAGRRGTYDYYPTRYTDWIERAKEAGFEVLREEGFCWAPFPRSSDSPLVKPATWIERHIGLRSLARFAPWVVTVLNRRR